MYDSQSSFLVCILASKSQILDVRITASALYGRRYPPPVPTARELHGPSEALCQNTISSELDGLTQSEKKSGGRMELHVSTKEGSIEGSSRSRVAAAVTAFSHLTLACGCRRIQWCPQAPPPTNASCPQRTGSCEPHDTARCCSDRRGATSSLQIKRPCFLNFAYVCPEPVLVKRSFLHTNGSPKRGVGPAPWWKETSPSCMASVTTGQFSLLTCSQTALSDSSEI
eukprot:COSAG06_NODE_21852_length_743_cov_0.878882_1_plen_225_part_01